MIIANPINDVIFKMLMENERIAKFFIGTILNVKIEELKSLAPKLKSTSQSGLRKLIIPKINFVATIPTSQAFKKVLIEVQKSHKTTDLTRFRKYLGRQYARRSEIETDTGFLPIVSIYVLGFNLPKVESPCVKIERRYVDCIGSKVLEVQHPFIEGLTHDSYFIQTRRLAGRPKTVLDKLLSVFEQNYFVETDTETRKAYNYAIEDEDLDLIIGTLRQAGESVAVQKDLEAEAWRTTEEHIKDHLKPVQQELQKTQVELSQKEQELLESKKKIAALEAQLNQNKS